MPDLQYQLRTIGRVRSSLTSLEDAPRQGSEGAPRAALQIDADVLEGLAGIRPGDEVIGLHRVRVLAIATGNLEVEPLEAIDGTPIVDIKPVWKSTDH